MKGKLTALFSCLVLLFVSSALHGQEAYRPEIITLTQDGFSSATGSATAGALRFGDVIDCRDAEMLILAITTSCTATRSVGIGIQWLPEDVGASNRVRPTCYPLSGDHFPLSSGWRLIDNLTTETYTSNGDYLVSAYIKAPYARIAVKARTNHTTLNRAVVRYCLRYRPQE